MLIHAQKIAAQMLAITDPKEHKALGRKSKVSMKMFGIRVCLARIIAHHANRY